MCHLRILASLSLIASLPLKALTPPRLEIQDASVTWGSGIEPRGPLPPARFQARVFFPGKALSAKVQARTQLRSWIAREADLVILAKGRTSAQVLGPSARLEAMTTQGPNASWNLQGTWPHAPKAEDRLVVELWTGSRRLAWGSSPLQEHALPQTGGRRREEP